METEHKVCELREDILQKEVDRLRIELRKLQDKIYDKEQKISDLHQKNLVLQSESDKKEMIITDLENQSNPEYS